MLFDFEFLLLDNVSGITYDISEAITKIDIKHEMEDTPAKLTFEVLVENTQNAAQDSLVLIYENSRIVINIGSAVRVRINKKGIFKGWIFTIEQKNKFVLSVTTYDQKRYFKSADTQVFKEQTASDRYKEILTLSGGGIKGVVIHPSTIPVPAKYYREQTYGFMIQDSIDNGLALGDNWYIIRDNFGVLEFRDVSKNYTNLAITEDVITSVNYSITIDKDTYNQIKLTKDNKAAGKREVYITQDSDHIKQWGLLQYHKSVDENSTPQQIEQLADNLLKYHNRVLKTLSCTCTSGNFDAIAGNIVKVELGLYNEKINFDMLIISSKHTITNNHITMDLDLELVT